MSAPVLVKIGGELLLDEAGRRRLCVALREVVSSGRPLAVVHGGGPQISALSKRLGLVPEMVAGRRVTGEATMQVVAMALAGDVATALLAAALAEGLPAVSMSASSGGLVRAVRRPPRRVRVPVPDRPGSAPGLEERTVDYGLVADVQRVDPSLVRTLWSGGFVPLLSSVVCDSVGQRLNLNADALASSLARVLGVRDLVLLTATAGILARVDEPASTIARLTDADALAWLASGRISGGMIAKMEEALAALASGVPRVHVIPLADTGAIAACLDPARAHPGTLLVAGEDTRS